MFTSRGMLVGLLSVALTVAHHATARAHAHTHGPHGSFGQPVIIGGFGGGFRSHGGYFFGPSTYVGYVPMFAPVWPIAPVPFGLNGAVAGPMPRALSPRKAVLPRRADPAKSAQMVLIGDRLFRAGNTKRAADRYEQAKKLNPDAAAPFVRLAQIALVRGDYAQAAERFREAVAAEPEFLAHAPNVTAIYAEPGDFRKQLSRLESRVLVEPGDRDAWLVLGAELFLSGQTKRAADVFTRLTDRRPDPALAAFLDASTPLPAEK